MLALAESMRALAADLDGHATLADARPDGYADAYRAIVTARDLGALAQKMSVAARAMADE
jgi:hypothetical protein